MDLSNKPQVIDLSHWNEVSSFASIKKDNIVGIIHKASEGVSNKDKTYFAHTRDANNIGLMIGSYHFGTNEDVKKQVDNYLSVVGISSNHLYCLDYEDSGKRTMHLSQAKEFIQELFNRTGKWCGLYSGNLIKETLADKEDDLLKNCFLWISHYTKSGKLPVIPANWSIWTLWQYTDGSYGSAGRKDISGVGKCDINYFNGSLENLKKLWGYSNG